MMTEVRIPTAEDSARAFVFRPNAGAGPWPAVILYMDACGVRPALYEMGDRLAQAGYLVLLPDVFWREAPYPPVDIPKLFGGDPEAWALVNRLRASADPARQMSDTAAWLAWLDGQADAAAEWLGVCGYCMGGAIALRAAGTFPDRIAAAASFHGGHLALDEAASPHRLAPQMRARILVAGADQDRHFDPAQCERLDRAFKAAGVEAEVSIWAGLHHGWVPRDMPVHDPAGADRHWQALLRLLAPLQDQRSGH